MSADLHSHSLHSDGVETPEWLVGRALAAGLRVLALTDHDSVEGVADARAAAEGTKLEVVAGCEFSCGWKGAEIHILGLFLDTRHEALRARLADLREVRSRRGEQIVRNLVEAGLPIDLDSIRATVGPGSFGRPHVGRALVAAGVVVDLNEAFDQWLVHGKPGWVEKPRFDSAEAIALIHDAGGLASIAHPVWSTDPDRLIRDLAALGLDAVEAHHPEHDRKFETKVRSLAADLRLAITAGSDFHETGRGRRVGLCQLEVDEVEILRRRLSGC